MKKLALIIAVAGIVGLTSCNKDYICTKTENGVTATVTLTEDDATICTDDGEPCETDTYDNSGIVTDKESAKEFMEDNGFSC